MKNNDNYETLRRRMMGAVQRMVRLVILRRARADCLAATLLHVDEMLKVAQPGGLDISAYVKPLSAALTIHRTQLEGLQGYATGQGWKNIGTATLLNQDYWNNMRGRMYEARDSLNAVARRLDDLLSQLGESPTLSPPEMSSLIPSVNDWVGNGLGDIASLWVEIEVLDKDLLLFQEFQAQREP